ncbi:MAG: Panacea domain-containing protein [Rhodospirillales bacterium]
MPAALRSAFVAAFWFAARARSKNAYLQPQKLQRLMYLAQCAFAARHGGRRLMPAVFVAEEAGPIEPNVHLALAAGRPDIDIEARIPSEAAAVLDDVWGRYGHCSTEHLTRITCDTAAYRLARRRGDGAEIDGDLMRLSSTARDAGTALPPARPKVLRTHTGRAVAIAAWTPGTKPTSLG